MKIGKVLQIHDILCGSAGLLSYALRGCRPHLSLRQNCEGARLYYRAPFFYEGDKDPDAYGVSAVMIIDRRSSAALPRIHRPFAN